MKRKLYWLGVPLLATALAASWWLGSVSSSDALKGVTGPAAEQGSFRLRDDAFTAGVALIDRRQYPQALAHFQDMVTRYPDLIEAHNNLAHVYAALGDVPAARAALEAGVQAQPSVQALVENLRKLHARESLLSLNKALQLERPPVSELALTRVNTIYAAQVGELGASDAVAEAKPQEPALPVPDRAADVSQKEAAQPAQVQFPEPAVPAAVAKPLPAPVAPADARAAAAVTDGVPVGAAPTGEPSVEQVVVAQLRAWARAWSAPNVPQYLSFYDDSFVPPNGLTRRSWEAERQSRIAGRSISVRLENIVVTPQGDRAVVRFRQHYRSGSFVSSVNKRQVWVRRGAQWRIASEGVA